MHRNRFLLGSYSLQRSPDHLAGRGPTSKEGEGEETGKGRKRMVLLPREEKEGGSEKGRGLAPQKKISAAATAPGGKLSAVAGRHFFFRAVYEV